jgi:truncated hemoglobin YjbI
MTTLLGWIGGRDAVIAAVDVFYKKILADSELSPFFETRRVDHQRKRKVSFLSSVIADTPKFTKVYMRNVHRPMVNKKSLNETRFALVAGRLSVTLDELGVDADTAAEVLAAVVNLDNHISNRDIQTDA